MEGRRRQEDEGRKGPRKMKEGGGRWRKVKGGGEHALKGLGRLLGVAFLVDSNVGVDGNDEEDNSELDPVGDLALGVLLNDGADHGDEGDDDKDADEDVSDLLPDLGQKGLLLRLGHGVGAVLLEGGSGGGVGQTGLGVVGCEAKILHRGLEGHGVVGRSIALDMVIILDLLSHGGEKQMDLQRNEKSLSSICVTVEVSER